MEEVYIVNQIDATPYESYFDDIYKVFSTEEKALKCIEDFTPRCTEYGVEYFLSSVVEVRKVE